MMPEENRPMTAEGYVMSELYKAKDHEDKLVEDLEEARDRIDELEEEIGFIRKMLKPFGFEIYIGSYCKYLNAHNDMISINEFGEKNVEAFLKILKGPEE